MKVKYKVVYVPPVYEEVQHEVTSVDDKNNPLRASFHTDVSLLQRIDNMRAVPQLDYSHVGIDRNLFKTDATDFPIPELDSIGMQTQYRCELSAPLIGLCDKLMPYEHSKNALDMAVTYGYAPRYSELKSARDYFEGGFCGAYSSWVTGYDEYFLRLWRRNLGSQSRYNAILMTSLSVVRLCSILSL